MADSSFLARLHRAFYLYCMRSFRFLFLRRWIFAAESYIMEKTWTEKRKGADRMRGLGRTLLRILSALALIAAAAVASLLLKETLDSTDPENNMPLIEASVGYTKLNVVRADFEWNYITRTVRGPALSDEQGDIPLAPLDVTPNTRLVIVMSDPNYISMKISRADGLADVNYIELYGDEILTPSVPGVYKYKIEVGYKKGSLLYYTAVRVAEGPTILLE